jgi:hypothetical protein
MINTIAVCSLLVFDATIWAHNFLLALTGRGLV